MAPRISTLDILAQYVGYTDWSHFCQQETLPSGEQQSESSEPVATRRKSPMKEDHATCPRDLPRSRMQNYAQKFCSLDYFSYFCKNIRKE
jgi:hypothetical protein